MGQNFYVKFGLSILVFATAQVASAQAPIYLNELALFQRCYSQLTSTRVKKSNPLYDQVKSGSKSAVNACLEVFNSAKLTANNNQSIANFQDAQAKNVLATFHRLHSSWFTVREFPVISFQGHNRDEKNIYDSTTPALYFTRALFRPNAQAREAITSNENLKAYRTNLDPATGSDTDSPKTDYGFSPLLQFAPTGELLGVQATGGLQLDFIAKGKVKGSVDIYKTLGAGAIGNTAYLLLNMPGIRDDYTTDGGVKMFRRWGKAVFNDVLCRDLPVVREADVINMVKPTAGISFRTSTACTKCHASQDRVASLVRNMTIASIGSPKGAPGQPERGGVFPNYYPVTKSAEMEWPYDADADYYARPASGTFYFRSYNGDLIDRPVSSVADLGQKISETDDYYICLAKRYYSYFTGVSINNSDLGDPWSVKQTTGDLYHRNVVVDLGKKLRVHQSLSTLISDILNLDNYKKVDFGTRTTGE